MIRWLPRTPGRRRAISMRRGSWATTAPCCASAPSRRRRSRASSRSWCWAPSIPRSARRRWRSACAPISTRSDILLSTHRGHGHTIAKGADTLAMMRELFGREGGTCHGKGGSMHIADFKVGMLGANGVVGANIVDRRRRRACRAAQEGQARSSPASSATAPSTAGPSSRGSTGPACGSCRSCSCARTTALPPPRARVP